VNYRQLAKELIPVSSQTFSKGPTQFVESIPSHATSGKGVYIDTSNDGKKYKEYIDWSMALGSVSIGYGELENLTYFPKGEPSFTLPSALEVVLAKKLNRLIPCAEMIRFGKNGSDVTTAAVRLARAVTGRDIVACCGYHGWHDWFIGTTTRNLGVPKVVQRLTKTFKYNDINSLRSIFEHNKGNVACVIMEPVSLEPPQDGFLSSVKALCRRYGALLIYDEVVTGFRFSMGGAQQYFGVTPDLACFGKAMANGYPLSALVGKAKYMRQFEDAFFSGTYFGDAVSLAASLSTIEIMEKENYIKLIWKQGLRLWHELKYSLSNEQLDHGWSIKGFCPRFVLNFPDLITKSIFQQECFKRGVLFTGAHNVCLSHTDEIIDKTIKVYKEVAEGMSQGKFKLKGKPIEPVFRKF